MVQVVSLPAENPEDAQFALEVAQVAALLPEVEEKPSALADMKPRWHGGPTRAMLKALKDECRHPGWNQDAAALVLQLIGDGHTLTDACSMASVSRAAVLAWARLEPEFGEMLAAVRSELGGWHQDKATKDDDPAMMRARLALAASYDRSIAKGAGEAVDGAPTLNVNVVW